MPISVHAFLVFLLCWFSTRGLSALWTLAVEGFDPIRSNGLFANSWDLLLRVVFDVVVLVWGVRILTKYPPKR